MRSRFSLCPASAPTGPRAVPTICLRQVRVDPPRCLPGGVGPQLRIGENARRLQCFGGQCSHPEPAQHGEPASRTSLASAAVPARASEEAREMSLAAQHGARARSRGRPCEPTILTSCPGSTDELSEVSRAHWALDYYLWQVRRVRSGYTLDSVSGYPRPRDCGAQRRTSGLRRQRLIHSRRKQVHDHRVHARGDRGARLRERRPDGGLGQTPLSLANPTVDRPRCRARHP